MAQEPETQESLLAPMEVARPEADLTPLTIIRTETVLSKLPIHHLAKKGEIDINITKKNSRGETSLHWDVTYAKKHGRPGPLAYKLDTLVIARRIEEAGRPLPPFIPLGSLRDIARELNLGGNTQKVKKALRQNAGAFITAKLTYKGLDGHDKSLEADFNRYGVIFTGEKLPNKHKADAVYVVFNEPYRDVLNNAPVRPLDYDYLKELPPAPQRFYEIVSYRIFAALKYRHTEAKLPYSEYCTFSAQQRYFEYEPFRKQMYKIHRPHLKKGYLARIRYAETRDAEGNPDWIMYYEPGPKARAEYRTFTGDRQRVVEATPRLEQTTATTNETPVRATRRATPSQRRLNFGHSDTPASVETAADHPVLAELTRRGIVLSTARQILASTKEPEIILDHLEWGDHLISKRAKDNPAGFYIYLIKENHLPPADFETSRKRQLREEAQRAHQEKAYERILLEERYQTYRTESIDRYIADHNLTAELQQLAAEGAKKIRLQWKSLPEKTLTELGQGQARQKITERMAPPLLTFEAFCAREQKSTGQPATETA